MAVVPYMAIRHLKQGATLSKSEVRALKVMRGVRYVAVRLAPKS